MGAVLKSATSPLLRSARLRPVASRAIDALPSTYRVIALMFFVDGSPGALYNPADRYSIYQDEAGAIPVEADGDPVGLMLDLSGNNNHLSQSVSAARPVYRTNGALHWIEFDGIDDALMGAQTAVTADGYFGCCAFEVNGLDGQSGGFPAFGTNSGTNRQGLRLRNSGGSVTIPSHEIRIDGGTLYDVSDGNGAYSENNPFIAAFSHDSQIIELQIDARDPVTDSAVVMGQSSASPNFAVRSGDVAGKFFGGLYVKRTVSASERARARSYIAQAAGVDL